MNESLLDGLSLALCKQSVGLWARDINTAPRMSQARRKHEPILPPSLRAGLEVSLAGAGCEGAPPWLSRCASCLFTWQSVGQPGPQRCPGCLWFATGTPDT